MKRHPTKANRQTPPSVYEQVCLRSGGTWTDGECKGGLCEICQGRVCGNKHLEFAHYGKHRQMGGTTSSFVHSTENVKRVGAKCHNKKDGHILARDTGKKPPIDLQSAMAGKGDGRGCDFEYFERMSKKIKGVVRGNNST